MNAPQGNQNWIRHTLQRVGGIPIDLKPAESFTIGRSQHCNLTIPSPKVSRQHAEIYWRGSQPFIRDKGSQNGTRIQGKRVSEKALEDGDEITIGPFICTYRMVDGVGSVGKVNESLDSMVRTEVMIGDALAGTFDSMNPFELLQTLNFNQKTGTLEVFTPDNDAIVCFQDGNPTWAEAGSVLGDEALLQMLTWSSGEFNFQPQLEEQGRNVENSMTNLLLEAGRRLDEGL